MNFTDTHTHLYDEAFGSADSQDEVIRRAIDSGVTRMVIPDNSPKERAAMFDVCHRWPENTRPCIGIHPEEVGENWKEEVDRLWDELPCHPTVCAIGETGMDLHWSKDRVTWQEEVFRAHIELAKEKGLPLIIHARDAWDHIFRILEDYRGQCLRGVFHAFSGSVETYRRIERLGGDWYVGIGGVITFKKASIAETVRDIPLERILLETDSPYLTPVPHRGERNESSYIPLIAAFLSERKAVDIALTASVTGENAATLFKLQ